MSVCVCVSTPAQRKAYESHYTLVKEIIPVLKSHAEIPVEIPVIIPVPPAVDVYALWIAAPNSRCLWFVAPSSRYHLGPYSSHLSGVKLGPKDHPHPAWCRTGPQG